MSGRACARVGGVGYTETMSYHTNIQKETEANENFRKVLFTGRNSQLVVMSIPAGDDIGEETLNGETFPAGAGDVVVVTPGTKHNFKNTGADALKIYTVYAPPNHIDGRIHKTHADAEADTEDEAFGHGV